MSRRLRWTRRPWVGTGLAVILAAAGLASTAPGETRKEGPGKALDHGLLAAHGQEAAAAALPSPVPADPPPIGEILVSAHTAGWITPCGCPGTQAGGIARRAGYGALLKKTFPGVDVAYFDLGGFMMDRNPVERTTTAAVIESYDRIGYAGLNVGFYDLGRSSDQARFLSRLEVPRFSANVLYDDTREPAFPPYLVRSFGGQGGEPPVRVGLIGVMDERQPLFAFGRDGRSLVAVPMAEALARYLPELDEKTDLIVLLAETRPENLHGLLADTTRVDFAIAGQGTQFVTAPALAGTTPYLALGNQGKNLAELRIARKDGRPTIVPFVHFLDERFPEDPTLARMAEEKIDAINEASRRDLESAPVPPAPTGPWVGAAACASCHADAYGVWKASRHAHAFATLQRLRRDYTLSCVSCHVTGAEAAEGGFVNPRATPLLLNVQCEQCHGAGKPHLDDPAAEYGKVDETRCLACHSGATDPHFDFATRWKTIAH